MIYRQKLSMKQEKSNIKVIFRREFHMVRTWIRVSSFFKVALRSTQRKSFSYHLQLQFMTPGFRNFFIITATTNGKNGECDCCIFDLVVNSNEIYIFSCLFNFDAMFEKYDLNNVMQIFTLMMGYWYINSLLL